MTFLLRRTCILTDLLLLSLPNLVLSKTYKENIKATILVYVHDSLSHHTCMVLFTFTRELPCITVADFVEASMVRCSWLSELLMRKSLYT